MSSAARRRLVRDFKRLQSDSPSGVTAAPNDNNILSWQVRRPPPPPPARARRTPPGGVSRPARSQAIIFGPDDTSWEGGTFKLELTFTEDLSLIHI